MTVLRFVPAANDPELLSAAEAANLHFRSVGLTTDTARAFRESLRQAGLKVQPSRIPGVLLMQYAPVVGGG